MKIKRLFFKPLTCLFLLLVGNFVYSQNVGINSTGATPNASAMLDIDASPANNRGLLIPRISLTQTSSNAPIGGGVVTSLFVYNTATINDVTPGYYYWDGTQWVRLLGNNNAWLLLGNAGTVAGTNFLGTTDAVDLVFKTNATERMRILSTGNIGIGTSTPAAKLHIYDPSNTYASPRLLVDGTFTNVVPNVNDVHFRANLDNNVNHVLLYLEHNNPAGLTPNGYLIKAIGGAFGSSYPVFCAGNNGYVGIGINAPSAYLEIKGTGTNLVRLQPNNGTENNVLTFGAAAAALNRAQIYSTGSLGDVNGDLRFAVGLAGVTIDPAMVIRSTGFVGIGTAAPSFPFHLYKSQNSTLFQLTENPNAGASAIAGVVSSTNAGFAGFQITSSAGGGWAQFGTTSSGGMYYDLGGAAGDHIWRTDPTYIEKMRLTHAGSLGIGTPAPTALLSVNGAANNTTGVWAIFSDARIKTVNSEFKDGLEVVKQICPVKFNYNEDAPFQSDNEQIGIVAQDLEKIAPYMVSKKEYKLYKDLREVNSQAYVFLLINAVKELNSKNEEQQKKIESLELKVQSSDLQNENLKAEVSNLKTEYGNRLKALEEILNARAQK